MSSNNSTSVIESKANIVQIITSYLPLTESRLILKGRCPFHSDDMSSLMVSPAKNIFKCFGCGKEGGPIEFVMAIENKKYDEAVVVLEGLI